MLIFIVYRMIRHKFVSVKGPPISQVFLCLNVCRYSYKQLSVYLLR
jgi:hypothetical protein